MIQRVPPNVRKSQVRSQSYMLLLSGDNNYQNYITGNNIPSIKGLELYSLQNHDKDVEVLIQRVPTNVKKSQVRSWSRRDTSNYF